MSTQLGSGFTRDAAGSGGTGSTCLYGGPYKCSTHPDVIVSFSKGQKFTACPMPVDASKTAAAGHSTNWAMVRETDAASFDTKVQSGGTAL